MIPALREPLQFTGPPPEFGRVYPTPSIQSELNDYVIGHPGCEWILNKAARLGLLKDQQKVVEKWTWEAAYEQVHKWNELTVAIGRTIIGSDVHPTRYVVQLAVIHCEEGPEAVKAAIDKIGSSPSERRP